MKTTTGRRVGRVWTGLVIGAGTFVVAVLLQSQLAGVVPLDGDASSARDVEPLPSAFVIPVSLAIACLAAVGTWAIQVVRAKRK